MKAAPRAALLIGIDSDETKANVSNLIVQTDRHISTLFYFRTLTVEPIHITAHSHFNMSVLAVMV